MTKKINYSEFDTVDFEFDFGFSAVDSSEIINPEVEKAVDSAVTQSTTQQLNEFKEKLKNLEGLILPLLVNLRKNPEKDFINWPNRAPAIDKQIEKILNITRSYENE